jgi:hypothetical protein
MFFLSAVLVFPLWGREGSGLFSSHEMLELTLTLDVKTVRKDIKEKRSYHGARLCHKNPAKEEQEILFPIKVKARGNFRRNPRVCDFPPLMLKFSKEFTKGTLFQGQKKLKLVTYCKKNLKVFEDYVMREYLIYRLYNILTEKSFKVRLVKVTYKDSVKKGKPLIRYGILIEDERQVARRLKMKVIKNNRGLAILRQVERRQRLVHAVFQFMIGHTDWSVPGEHNVKLVQDKGTGVVFPLPYDFDLAGLVDAHYAKPSPQLAIKSVRERLYRGYCAPHEALRPVLDHFNEKKEELYALIEGLPLLKEKLKKSTTRYLGRFYKILDNPRQVKRYFMDNCR